ASCVRVFFFQAEDGIRDWSVTGVQTCALPISAWLLALLVGERDIEREQPSGRRVDGHRRVHRSERDVVEQRAHVAEMRDRHADLDRKSVVKGKSVDLGGRRVIKDEREREEEGG